MISHPAPKSKSQIVTTLARLRAQPARVLVPLALFLVGGALDLGYHVLLLFSPALWNWAHALPPNDRLLLDVAEAGLHGLVALGLIGFVIAAIHQRLLEDERRQLEREGRAK